MELKTKVFELAKGRFKNLADLAEAMDLSISQVYRVKKGERGINESFSIGAKRAFPELTLDDLTCD